MPFQFRKHECHNLPYDVQNDDVSAEVIKNWWKYMYKYRCISVYGWFKDDKYVIWMWIWLILKNISLLDRIWWVIFGVLFWLGKLIFSVSNIPFIFTGLYNCSDCWSVPLMVIFIVFFITNIKIGNSPVLFKIHQHH
jgi:uncharacterized integral membrane protein